jgi:hypothetical protein
MIGVSNRLSFDVLHFVYIFMLNVKISPQNMMVLSGKGIELRRYYRNIVIVTYSRNISYVTDILYFSLHFQ